MPILPGKPHPLGATWDGSGTNYAVFSEQATGVELCLFDSPDARSESERVRLRRQSDHVWQGYLTGVGPGQSYGYRVHGPYHPREGQRFNPNKVVLDPYAKAISRPLRWSDEVFGYVRDDPTDDLSFDERDSAPWAPLAAVLDPNFSWGDDRPPQVPWEDTVIYEVHVKGFTKRHPDIPEKLRGTYLGLCSDPALRHLKELGVTAVELLPIHYSVDEHRLVKLGLSNYWGYNPLAYSAPDPRFAGEPVAAVQEFKTMVRRLHEAGLEVILDVVYNHTAESDHSGPTLSLRGIDNASYYRLRRKRRLYEDLAGCGNTLDIRHPWALKLVMDSLRYWVTEMHVDGFRFDLATVLGRDPEAFTSHAPFFKAVHQDPVLSQVKLIGEPWDLGPGGYHVGGFPAGWSEWNGKYRDDVRRFWKRDHGTTPGLATRFAGSSDLYRRHGRRPTAGVNFVTAHDGFTLHDLVSYEKKHNDANGEGNRDGENHNYSSNWGVEGPTDDHSIVMLRERIKRNLLATLLLSQGVPMLSAGDEICRTQHGNNNAYCQDNELTWLDWELGREQQRFLDFTRYVLELRRSQPVLRRSSFFQGRMPGPGNYDLVWFHDAGPEIDQRHWGDPSVWCVGALLNGEFTGRVDEQGQAIRGDTLFVILNAAYDTIRFKLPQPPQEQKWQRILDTAANQWGEPHNVSTDTYGVEPQSVVVFRGARLSS